MVRKTSARNMNKRGQFNHLTFLKESQQRIIKDREAQFKIQQSAFMILGVVLFFIIVGLFWLTLKSSSINKGYSEIKQEQAVGLALTISDSPELTCGVQCVDYDKAIVLKNTRLFESLWPVSSVQIRKVYPNSVGKTIIECNSGNYDNCNLLVIENKAIKPSGGVASSFIKLCRKEKNAAGYTYDKCELGEIIVKT